MTDRGLWVATYESVPVLAVGLGCQTDLPTGAYLFESHESGLVTRFSGAFQVDRRIRDKAHRWLLSIALTPQLA